ncbi:phosphopantetheine-binding protein [Actinosynnema sp. NPDC023794]
MTDHAWDVDFERIVRQALTALPAGEPLRGDADLGALGLDSIKAIQLLFALEDAYGIEVPDRVLEASLFATPRNLWEVVRSLGAGGDTPADETGQHAEV